MNIKIYETSSRNQQKYDITNIVSSPRWTTSLGSQAGTFEFSIQKDKAVFIRDGDLIEVVIDGKNTFKGKVFVRGKKKDKFWTIKAYDNLRYLQNQDTIVFGVGKLSDRFIKICQLQGLSYKVLDANGYQLAEKVEDNESYYSMLEAAIQEVRENNNARFGIRDNFGTLELFDLNRGITKLLIGDESLLSDYDYEASIDDAYNVVKVIKEDSETKQRQVFTASNSGLIDRWGKLQMVEKVNESDLNTVQLQQKANDLLKANAKEVRTLTLNVVGVFPLQAGNSFTLNISDLQSEGINADSLALITKCTHNFNTTHTMSLEVEVI
nr:MAG TPA: 43 kDa tail protein [Caudoviricetes sp.]